MKSVILFIFMIRAIPKCAGSYHMSMLTSKGLNAYLTKLVIYETMKCRAQTISKMLDQKDQNA